MAVDDVSAKIFIVVLVFFLLNIGTLTLFFKTKKEDFGLYVLGLDVIKFLLLVSGLLIFINPTKPHNHTPALLFCLNYFIFQATFIYIISKRKH